MTDAQVQLRDNKEARPNPTIPNFPYSNPLKLLVIPSVFTNSPAIAIQSFYPHSLGLPSPDLTRPSRNMIATSQRTSCVVARPPTSILRVIPVTLTDFLGCLQWHLHSLAPLSHHLDSHCRWLGCSTHESAPLTRALADYYGTWLWFA